MPLAQVQKKIESMLFARVESMLCTSKATFKPEAMSLRRSPRIAAKMPQAPMSAATASVAVCEPTEAKAMPSISKKLPAVRKHPHVERVYLCDPKDTSYMLTREEANTLAHWDFSEEDWDIIFCGESLVSLGTLCNEMTESCFRYGGLARAQMHRLQVENDQYRCWNCNEFSSTLALSREEANALGIWNEFSEEEWEWIFCCGATDKVEVGAICTTLTPHWAFSARRRAEEEAVAPPPSPVLEVAAPEEEAIPPMPLLTPKLLRQQAVDLPKPRAKGQLSPEAREWVRTFKARLLGLPSGKDSIYRFLDRCEAIGNLLQSLLSSPHLLEVLQMERKGPQFAKALMQAVHNLSGDEELVAKRMAELKYYRCPHWMTAKLKHTYKRIQDLSAIMSATATPYIDKSD